MRILYDNKVLAATIAATTEHPNYPVENLQTDRLAEIYKSVGDTAQSLVFDLSAAYAITYFAVFAHNIAVGATLTLEGNTSDSWTTPAYSTTITHGTGAIVAEVFGTYRYWRMTVDDNSGTALSIGYVYLGGYLQGPGMAIDQEIDDNTEADAEFSTSGQLYGGDGVNYRTFKINFVNISDTVRANMRTWFAYSKNYRPFIMLLWAGDLTKEKPVFAVIADKKISWKRTKSVLLPWQTGINFREVF